MANAAKYKKIEGYTDRQYTVVAEYDFANDTGAQATYSLGIFKHKTLILSSRVFVETAGSGTGATVAIGPSTADPDGILDATDGAVANLTDNAVVSTSATASNLVVAAGETLDLVIATADLESGKFKVILECINVE
jgi:hypothetical protein